MSGSIDAMRFLVGVSRYMMPRLGGFLREIRSRSNRPAACLPAVLTRRLTRLAFKHHAQVLRMLVARQLSDLLQAQVGFRQQLFDALQLHRADLCLRRPAKVLAEAAL